MNNLINNIILFFALLFLSIALFKSVPAHAAVTKPPPPPSTGSATLDAINKFIYDTVNWQQGDPVPDTGSSTLNAIGKAMLDTANYGSGSSGSAGGGFSGTGAGGSWGGAGASDPYNGNGGSSSQEWGGDWGSSCGSPIYNAGGGAKSANTLEGALKNYLGTLPFTYTILKVTPDYIYVSYKYTTINNSGNINVSVSNKSCQCPQGYSFDSVTRTCVPICSGSSVFDSATGKCVVDPNKCLSPYTFINGVCVPPKTPDPETKTCPYGYTLTNGQCVKNPDKPCDPAVQECNPDGTVKCDCCQKLDTIIGNQGVQIGLQNKSNASLSQIIANQQTNNLKLDQLNNQLTQLNSIAQNTNSNLQVIQNQIAELLKLQKEGVKLDLTPIIKKIDDIITNDNKNHSERTANDNKNHDELTGLIARALIDSETEKPFLREIYDYLRKQQSKDIASAVAPLTQEITDRQDEQTDVLKEIRDLFKEDKENPTPPPEVTPEEQESSLNNPLDGLRNYDISQNRFGGSAQCPNDRQFVALGATFTIGMSRFCDYLAMFGSVFLAMAYIAGGIIVVKGAGGN